jgi:hypothetical protein
MRQMSLVRLPSDLLQNVYRVDMVLVVYDVYRIDDRCVDPDQWLSLVPHLTSPLSPS